MKAALILAHGSRENSTEKTLSAVASKVRQILPDVTVREAYMQFRESSLTTGLEELAAEGYDEIAVVPYFLFAGVHIKEDIPSEIASFCERYPGVRVSLGQPLGEDERLASLLSDRILEMI